jgi:DNA-binding NarL/FixJ family response regulator
LLQRRQIEHPLSRLTPREREVLEHMAAGNSNQGIADAMVITLRAAEKYVSTVFDKLGIAATRQDSRRVLAVLHYSGAETRADQIMGTSASMPAALHRSR